MTKKLGRGIDLLIGVAIGALLVLLIAWVLLGCSLKGYDRDRVLSLHTQIYGR